MAPCGCWPRMARKASPEEGVPLEGVPRKASRWLAVLVQVDASLGTRHPPVSTPSRRRGVRPPVLLRLPPLDHIPLLARPSPPPAPRHGIPPTLHTVQPTPYTVHRTAYTMHPTPYTLLPTPYTPTPTHHTIHTPPHTLNPERSGRGWPCGSAPRSSARNSSPWYLPLCRVSGEDVSNSLI